MSDIMNAPIVESPASTTTNPDSVPGTDAWVTSITDAELLGHLQNRGWHKLPANEAAVEAVKAFRNVERMIGAPPDQMLRIQRADDEAGTKAFWERLGYTDKPEDFKFEGIQFDDPEWQSQFTDMMRKVAIDNHIPREMAEKMARQVFEFSADQGAKREAANTAARQAEQQELQRDWGAPETARFKAAVYVADKAIDALGITPEQQQQLVDAMGRPAVARLFHKIGTAMQEDRFVAGDAPASASGIMTRDQAVARRTELIGDKDFRDRFERGEPSARKELEALIRIISGV